MDAPTVEPPPKELTFESAFTRRSILASYWLVIILALPLWWTTTSIDRLSLPASRVSAQQHRELVFPVNVGLNAEDPINATSIASELQLLLDDDWDMQRHGGIRITVESAQNDPAGYQIFLRHGTRDPVVEGRCLNFEVTDAHGTSTKVLAMQLADTMSTLLAPFLTLRSAQDQEGCIVKYAPRYRLAFTLLNEDAASGNAAIAWDVREAISKHITPTLDRLSILHNFTIESQIQFHAPLAFEPRTLEIDNMVKFGLIQEDLTVFINSAEWTLSSSVSSDPVLHFVLFLPSWRNRPLHILSDDGVAVSNAFILPQWGGITILNPMSSSPGPLHLTASSLDTVFLTFRHQLLALLGVPKLPISIQSNQSAIFTDWQLDALLRRRAAENVEGGKETLRSIVNLVAQINNMPVGQDVRGDVQDALTALDEAYSAASFSSAHTLRHSSRALTLASRAFFSPGMLALLYFPAEHKYAVYTPLFASIAAPLIAAVVREILAQRRAYRAAHEKYVTKAESTTRRTKAD